VQQPRRQDVARVLLIVAGGLASLLSAGCDDDKEVTTLPPSAGGPSNPFQVNGKTTGSAQAPASAQLAIVWQVSSTDPDYSYKFGVGSFTDTRFVAEVGTAPPPEAINANGVGVGLVIALEPGFTLAEGKVDLDKETLNAKIVGAAPRAAVIWRDTSKAGFGWSREFPAGYACGRCVPAAAGETFDSYEPVACDQVELSFSSDVEAFDVCNWM
jgi:hypothetical protein